jgi:serine/threonine protein kinase
MKKQYVVNLVHLKKTKGGRLKDTHTFCSVCDEKKADIKWFLHETLRSGQEASDGFAFLGVTKSLLDQPFVVKLMVKTKMALREVAALEMFRQKPHQNVVQGICHFECSDNPMRWMDELKEPQELCTNNGTSFIVIVQENIQRGHLSSHKRLSFAEIASILLQLTCATIELYQHYGLYYGDWHDGNILIDTTDQASHTYECFGHTIQVTTHTIRPVITDFSRYGKTHDSAHLPNDIADQVSLVWDLLYSQLGAASDYVRMKSLEVGSLTEFEDIMICVKDVHNYLENVATF